ncbi:hypothetical protein GGS21DRAFT_390592 [Xylaria nigripes]|nr:hypothetical protein GGS21DRAFT_390592 [Xylaria nigripes]
MARDQSARILAVSFLHGFLLFRRDRCKHRTLTTHKTKHQIPIRKHNSTPHLPSHPKQTNKQNPPSTKLPRPPLLLLLLLRPPSLLPGPNKLQMPRALAQQPLRLPRDAGRQFPLQLIRRAALFRLHHARALLRRLRLVLARRRCARGWFLGRALRHGCAFMRGALRCACACVCVCVWAKLVFMKGVFFFFAGGGFMTRLCGAS